jgi:Ca2+-binding EF-hand superfamily protein
MKTRLLILAALLAAAVPVCAQPTPGQDSDGPGPSGSFQPPSPAQVAARMIQQFDANGTGALDQAELAQALAAQMQHGPRFSGQRGFDPNSSGTTTQNSTGGQPSGPGDRPPPPSPSDLAAHLIQQFDTTGAGSLNQAELTAALTELRAHRGPPPPNPSELASHLIQQYGTNGVIDQPGLTAALTELRSRRGPPPPSENGNSTASSASGNSTTSTNDASGTSNQQVTPPSPSSVAASLIARFDTNNTGSLNQTELAAALATLPHGRGGPPPHGPGGFGPNDSGSGPSGGPGGDSGSGPQDGFGGPPPPPPDGGN